ncbi:MAG: hypothetical protein ACYDGW_07120 [Vulcanimicrobiaceae bacterium]
MVFVWKLDRPGRSLRDILDVAEVVDDNNQPGNQPTGQQCSLRQHAPRIVNVRIRQ